MNIYDSLNQGDGSIKEAHLTSMLYYLLKNTFEIDNKVNLLEKFIEAFLSDKIIKSRPTDMESDFKIEQILKSEKLRKDCDITIFCNSHSNQKVIINIENKISYSSITENQISDQNELLKLKYPDFEVYNFLLLPYPKDVNINIDLTNCRLIYWFNSEKPLINLIDYFMNEIVSAPLLQYSKHFILSIKDFFQAFGDQIEQDLDSESSLIRGPKNKYKKSMYDYLNEICQDWGTKIFTNHIVPIRVSDLLNEFESRVTNDIKNSTEKSISEKNEMIAKFKRGALEAQPKIMTINEKNRTHFNIYQKGIKGLFYYPDYLDGVYDIRWKDLRILPLNKISNNEKCIEFWREKDSGEIKSDTYTKAN
ncbi:PD-(D/E)XK nuclease family protein [Aquirufa nivalisilvae]